MFGRKPQSVEYVKSSFPSWIKDIESLDGSQPSDSLTAQSAWQMAGWMRRCVDIRAQALSDLPFNVYREGTDTVVWNSDEQTPTGLEWMSDLTGFLWRSEASLCLKGAAYSLKRVERGRDTGLQWLSPLTMEPKYADDGRVVAFERRVGNRTFTLPADAVLYVWSRDPFQENGPGSPLERAAHLGAEVLYQLNRFADNFLDRGMIKASLVTVPPMTGKDERDRLEMWWQRWFRGKDTTTKVVSADVKPVVVGDGLGDLANTNLTVLTRQEIAAVFGVPESMMTSSAANYATAYVDQLGFYQWTVLPDAKAITTALNRQYLVPRGLFIEIEEERIEAIQRAEVEKAQAVAQLVGGSPILTVNEARELLGYDPISGADEVEETQPSRDVVEEVRAWRRKVKAKGRDVAFEPVHLRPSAYAAIKARLESGAELDDAFAQPWRNW